MQSYLLPTDEEWTHHQSAGLVVLRLCCLIVVQDVQQHRREEEDEAARASLHSCEMIDYSLGKDREPQMAIGHVVVGFLCEHIAELVLFHVVRDGKEPLNLPERMSSRRDFMLSCEPAYQPIALVHR